NATEVALQPEMSITFDEEVELGMEGSLQLMDGTTVLKAYDLSIAADREAFTLSADQLTLSWAMTEDLPVNTNIAVAISAGFVQDAAGNDFAGITAASGAWNFTTINKVMVSSVSVPENDIYGIGQTLTFTVNYPQAITVNTDDGIPYIPVTIGSTTYNATYTGGSGTTALTFGYTVQAGDEDTDGVALGTDIVLNGGDVGLGSTELNNIGSAIDVLVDGIRPTATIVVADAALKADETSLVTITFSEAVTGFTNTDLTVANGTLSTVSSSDGGITWTATLTPTADIEDVTNVITLDNAAVTDAAGNAGTGTTESNNYAIDTKAPAIPTGLAAAFGNTQNVLSWIANTDADLVSYKVYGGTSANPTALLTTVTAPAVTYTHTGLPNGTTYYYHITAVDAAG